MQFDDVILGRRSIRGYLDKPVPKALIREILELAMRAPTSLNTQPWNFYVVAGAVLDRIRKGNVERNLAGVPHSREFRLGPGYEGAHRERQIGVAKQLFAAMGIARDDGAGRMAAMGRNTTSFDAPAVLFVYFPRLMKEPQWSDVGMWLQTVALLLREEGLDSCFQEFMALYANTIRDFLGLDHERYMFFCGMAIGYRDPDAPVNNFERQRVPLEEHVKFIGF